MDALMIGSFIILSSARGWGQHGVVSHCFIIDGGTRVEYPEKRIDL